MWRMWHLSSIIIILILAGVILFIPRMVSQPAPQKPSEKKSSKNNIYNSVNRGELSPVAKRALPRVYVPNSLDNTVSIIDPKTYTVIQTFVTAKMPQHIVPSYDLKTLWVLNNKGNSTTPINPNTARPGMNIPIDDPYNLYFTPDGKYAMLVCEARKEIQFRDPQTMVFRHTLPIQCRGANHMDFTADGQYAIVTCEYSGVLFKMDVINPKVVAYMSLNKLQAKKSMPQDIRSSPDGRTFYVADMMSNGVFLIDPIKFETIGFIPTGLGAHGIYPGHDGKLFYVSNRGCDHMRCGPKRPGSVSVIDTDKQAVVGQWMVPQGGSPDMGNLSTDGKELWLSGRYDSEVYVFDISNGDLKYRIPVGRGPHGLSFWPQPGRYSLGHTGNMR